MDNNRQKRSKERNKKYEARRDKVHLPDGTDIKRFINVESERTGMPKWKVLQGLYEFYQEHHKTPEEQIIDKYDEFIKSASIIAPDHENDLHYLKKHILRRIFKFKSDLGEDPGDEYYDKLKKI